MKPGEQVYIVQPPKDDVATRKSKRYKDMMADREFLRKYQREHGAPPHERCPSFALRWQPAHALASFPRRGAGGHRVASARSAVIHRCCLQTHCTPPAYCACRSAMAEPDWPRATAASHLERQCAGRQASRGIPIWQARLRRRRVCHESQHTRSPDAGGAVSGARRSSRLRHRKSSECGAARPKCDLVAR